MLRNILALVLAGTAVEATPSCEEYFMWTHTYCPAWEFGDECIDTEWGAGRVPIYKKYKCEPKGLGITGEWNFKYKVDEDGNKEKRRRAEDLPKCHEYFPWTVSHCPAWEFGDECIDPDWLDWGPGGRIPIYKKYKCEPKGLGISGQWNYKEDVDREWPKHLGEIKRRRAEDLPKCEEYFPWTVSYCPAWEFGDECLDTEWLAGRRSVLKKYKCEPKGLGITGEWNYKGVVKDTGLHLDENKRRRAEEKARLARSEETTLPSKVDQLVDDIQEIVTSAFGLWLAELSEEDQKRATDYNLLADILDLTRDQVVSDVTDEGLFEEDLFEERRKIHDETPVEEVEDYFISVLFPSLLEELPEA